MSGNLSIFISMPLTLYIHVPTISFSLQSLQEEVDALDRRNQELVLEISAKREKSTVYSSGKRRPVTE